MTGQDSKAAQLSQFIPEWEDIDGSLRVRLLAETNIASLNKGNFVFRSGDRCEGFLILVSGSVRVQMISLGGREATLYRVRRGGSCILTTSCLISHEHYPAEAIAESDVTALAISKDAFEAALEQSAGFRRFIFDGFSSRLANVIQKIEEIAFTSVDVRLAEFLLTLRGDREHGLTHQEIAAELGTAREVVSRILKRFEKRGWVELGRARITVVDGTSLRSFVDSV